MENPVEVNKRVSVAWLCFDKEKVIKKNGLDYRKCNQPNCGVMYQVVEGTATSMSRHVQRRHRHLLQKNNLEKHKQTTISYSGKKTKLMPSFSQDSFNTYLVDLFVVQDLPFLLIESAEFRDLVQLLRRDTTVVKADALKNMAFLMVSMMRESW